MTGRTDGCAGGDEVRACAGADARAATGAADPGWVSAANSQRNETPFESVYCQNTGNPIFGAIWLYIFDE